MFKNIILLIVVTLATISSSFVLAQSPFAYSFDKLDNMPVLESLPVGYNGSTPIAERGEEYKKFLSASVKINVSGSSGSGTIIYYDPIKNLAYVASCGHLWSQGTMSVEEGLRRKMTCKVTTWYHNDEKLSTPKSYNANVIFYSHVRGADTSLITFTPDWEPNYFPIAPITYKYSPGEYAHSLGCDGGSEVAHYRIKIIGLSSSDLVTIENSPRPGRSGGGLMDEEYYIGTCWGTQYVNGSGKGFFTPLSAIHKYWSKQKGYEFLLNQSVGLAKKIPIIDRNNSQGEYSKDYILMPGK